MAPRGPTQPAFDAHSASYELDLARGLTLSGEGQAFFAEGRMLHLRDVLRRLGHRPGRALDFGCGAGTSTPFLLDVLGAEAVVGVDVSAGLLDRARSEHGSTRARFLARDDLPTEPAFDLAFCNGVFHHIPPAERVEAVGYVCRRLGKRGFFALWENNPWNPGTLWVMSRIPFDRDAITLSPPETRRLLAENGFEVIRTDFLFFFPRMLRWLRRWEPRLLAVPLGAQYLVLGRKR